MATAPVFSIEDFLQQETQKDLLRFSTAGSVDDGKSTLIGRLLYDTQSVYEDQVRSIEGKGTTAPGQIDFALLTDGLRAEREQGITIDVAYRYFSTGKRKFIIADTPGHEQYTRNMATGASTADAAVVLIDASKGVLLQSRRHAYIASLLRVRHLLVAVNKMDLIGYDEKRFRTIVGDFTALLAQIAEDTGNPVEAHYIPVSALAGDNVVHRSERTPWYEGASLLELLESLPPSEAAISAPFRFPVQRVLRPDHTFRGFAGQIASGLIRVGDAIAVQPSGLTAKIARIVTFDGDLQAAQAPESVTLVLDREVDISRGDLIVTDEVRAQVAREVEASLVWMDQTPLDTNRRYLLKHTSHTVPAFVAAVEHRTDIATLDHLAASTLEMNGIGLVRIRLLRPIALDAYGKNRATGAFILVDPATNGTIAAGMIRSANESTGSNEDGILTANGPVTQLERSARWGHQGGVLEIHGSSEAADAIERSLFAAGTALARIDAAAEIFQRRPALLSAHLELLTAEGILALVVHANSGDSLSLRAAGKQVTVATEDRGAAVDAAQKLLLEAEILHDTERAGL